MSPLLAPVMVLFLVAGQSLSPERPLDEPSWWPSGTNPSLARTQTGYLLSMEVVRRGFLRPVGLDGTLGPTFRLGHVTSEGIMLRASALGVVALYTPRLGERYASQLLDPTTGAPLGEPRPLALNNVSPSRLWLSGPPGRLVWAHIDYSADAGFRSWLGGLNDDGSPKNDERDITALGSLNALVSTPSHHWASFQLRGADGGTVSVLHRFDGDGGDETVAQFDGPTAALALADTGVVRVGVTATGVQAAFLSQTGQPLGEVPFARSCSSLVAAGRGEELWVGCAEVNTPLEWSSTLSLTRGSPPAQES